jgi:uncharacterized protein
MHRLIVAVVALLFAIPASADPYPAYRDPFVNDYALAIDDDAEARIRASLETLKAETGIEATVLTIPTRDTYDPSPSLEAFATGLFNTWGIGDATRNDGILILVVTLDREMRIELGAGYDRGYDVLAKSILDRFFLPAFGEGRMSEGIETGTRETVERIARRHAARLPPEALPGATDRTGPVAVIFGAIFAAIAGLIVFGRRIGDFLVRMRACPQCGQKTLSRQSSTLRTPTENMDGLRRDVTTCSNCGYRDSRDVPITARSRSRSSGSFGGGRSSGGGASGKW